MSKRKIPPSQRREYQAQRWAWDQYQVYFCGSEQQRPAWEQNPKVRCAVCERAPCRTVCLWVMHEEFCREHGITNHADQPHATMGYKLCDECAAQLNTEGFTARIEAAIIQRMDSIVSRAKAMQS